jgi:cyanide hydratase
MVDYYRHSVAVDSTHMVKIRTAARTANIMVILGISERHRGSLYMAQTFIGPDGDVLLHRRKFKPTGPERIVFGDAVRFPFQHRETTFLYGGANIKA